MGEFGDLDSKEETEKLTRLRPPFSHPLRLNQFDGTDHQYFHEGAKGRHELWDS